MTRAGKICGIVHVILSLLGLAAALVLIIIAIITATV